VEVGSAVAAGKVKESGAVVGAGEATAGVDEEGAEIGESDSNEESEEETLAEIRARKNSPRREKRSSHRKGKDRVQKRPRPPAPGRRGGKVTKRRRRGRGRCKKMAKAKVTRPNPGAAGDDGDAKD
jgi:hypothetical protein